MDDITPQAASSDPLDDIAAIPDPYDRAEQAWEVAERLIDADQLSAAEAICKYMEAWPQERSWHTGRIAARRWALGDREQAERLLLLARSLATECHAQWQRAEALVMAARRAHEVGWVEPCLGLLSEAVDVANIGQLGGNMQDSLDSGSVLGEAAVLLAELGFRDLAQHALTLVANEAKRGRVAHRVSEAIRRQEAG